MDCLNPFTDCIVFLWTGSNSTARQSRDSLERVGVQGVLTPAPCASTVPKESSTSLQSIAIASEQTPPHWLFCLESHRSLPLHAFGTDVQKIRVVGWGRTCCCSSVWNNVIQKGNQAFFSPANKWLDVPYRCTLLQHALLDLTWKFSDSKPLPRRR